MIQDSAAPVDIHTPILKVILSAYLWYFQHRSASLFLSPPPCMLSTLKENSLQKVYLAVS